MDELLRELAPRHGAEAWLTSAPLVLFTAAQFDLAVLAIVVVYFMAYAEMDQASPATR